MNLFFYIYKWEYSVKDFKVWPTKNEVSTILWDGGSIFFVPKIGLIARDNPKFPLIVRKFSEIPSRSRMLAIAVTFLLSWKRLVIDEWNGSRLMGVNFFKKFTLICSNLIYIVLVHTTLLLHNIIRSIKISCSSSYIINW